MGDTTSVNLRIDKELKSQAESLFASLGMNMTTAINVFLKQAVREQGLPFRVSASKDYAFIPDCNNNFDQYRNYDNYVNENLRAADTRVADGNMKYYSADEIKTKLEELLNEKI